MLNYAAYAIATGLWSGYLPGAPGTWGSLLGLAVAFPLSLKAFTLALMVGSALGYWSIKWVIDREENSDPSWVVIDEILGLWLALYCLQMMGIPGTSINSVLTFSLFRLFDILKPWPIYMLEQYCARSPHLAPAGVLMDDFLAALYTIVCMYYGHAVWSGYLF